METLHPRVSLWLLVLGTAVLLGWGTQPVWGIEDINEEALATILSHVKRGMSGYGQFAIAMLLSREACEKSTTAEQEGATIEDKLHHIKTKGILTEAAFRMEDNILVAIVQKNDNDNKVWHAEAVLVGTMAPDVISHNNFLKWFLNEQKQHYPPDNSCFIFFSLISPCLDYCLNPKSNTYILRALQDSLQGYDPHFQAFAFEHVYREDQPKGQIKVWEAWRQIPMPLFRCSLTRYDTSCTRCRGLQSTRCFLDIVTPSNKNHG